MEQNASVPTYSADNRYNRRMAIRYDCIDLAGVFEGEQVTVTNLSLDGGAIETTCDYLVEPGNYKKISLCEMGIEELFYILLTGKDHIENAYRYHFKFHRPQRPEKMGVLNRHFSKPNECPISTHQRYDRQKSLAENDIDDLQNTIQGLKNCQFQLVFAAIPILFGLLASTVAFIANKPDRVVHDFYYVLAPASIVLCFVLLAVFIQKTESIRRASAFTLILQRHLAMGSLPACYRGWHDANENYNHFVRHGAEKASPFEVAPFQEKHIKNRVPADSFTWLAVGLFATIIISSMLLMYYSLITAVGENRLDIENYTMIVFVVTIFLVAAGIWFYRKYRSLTVGKRSFRYLVVLFSKLLKYAPPFDPYRNDPISTHKNPLPTNK